MPLPLPRSPLDRSDSHLVNLQAVLYFTRAQGKTMGWVGCSRGVRLQVAFVENLISARRTSLLSQSRLLGAYHVIPLLVSAQAVPDKSLTGSMLQYPLVKLSNMKEVYYIKRRLVQCLINLIVILETSKERVWFPRKHIRINSLLYSTVSQRRTQLLVTIFLLT